MRLKCAMLSGASVTIIAVIAAAIFIAPKVRTPQQAAADAAPPPASPVTVPAQNRTLVEPVVLRGHVRPGHSVALLPPAQTTGDTSVVTAVKVQTGQQLTEGRVVLERSGEPMFALVLPFPLYRDLPTGANGPDVAEIQRALRRLGYRIRISSTFDPDTQQAVGRLYRDRGYQPPHGKPDAVAQLPGATQAAAQAQQEYDEAKRTGTGEAAAKARLDSAHATLAALQLAAGPMLSRSAVLLIDRADRKISAVRVSVGTVLTDPKASLIELDGEPNYVVAHISADQKALLTVGQQATIFDDTTADTAAATVASVGTEAQTTDSGTGIEVVLQFTGKALTANAERSVRIDVAAATDTTKVLAVPVTAVYSRPDGSTFVTVAQPDGSNLDIDVIAGRTAGGWVHVQPTQPGQLPEGTPVIVGEGQ